MGATVLCHMMIGVTPIPEEAGFGPVLYSLWEETYEKNCYPHTPHWSCAFVGTFADICRRATLIASHAEGGMLQVRGNRDAKPENVMGTFWRAARHPMTLHASQVEISELIGQRQAYCQHDAEEHARQRAWVDSVKQKDIETKAGHLSFDMVNPEHVRLVVTSIHERVFSAWQFFRYPPRMSYDGAPLDIPMASPDRSGIEAIVDGFAAWRLREDRLGAVLLGRLHTGEPIGFGSWRGGRPRDSRKWELLGYLIESVPDIEYRHPGALHVLLPLIRAKIDNASELPPSTMLTIGVDRTNSDSTALTERLMSVGRLLDENRWQLTAGTLREIPYLSAVMIFDADLPKAEGQSAAEIASDLRTKKASVRKSVGIGAVVIHPDIGSMTVTGKLGRQRWALSTPRGKMQASSRLLNNLLRTQNAA